MSVVLDGQLISTSASRCPGGMQAVCEAAPRILPGLQAQLDVLPCQTSLPDTSAGAGQAADAEWLLSRHVQSQSRHRAQRAAAQACVRLCEELPYSSASQAAMQVGRR